jgi:hypothetical protein
MREPTSPESPADLLELLAVTPMVSLSRCLRRRRIWSHEADKASTFAIDSADDRAEGANSDEENDDALPPHDK